MLSLGLSRVPIESEEACCGHHPKSMALQHRGCLTAAVRLVQAGANHSSTSNWSKKTPALALCCLDQMVRKCAGGGGLGR